MSFLLRTLHYLCAGSVTRLGFKSTNFSSLALFLQMKGLGNPLTTSTLGKVNGSAFVMLTQVSEENCTDWPSITLLGLSYVAQMGSRQGPRWTRQLGLIWTIWVPVIPFGPHVSYPSGSHISAPKYPIGFQIFFVLGCEPNI